MVESGISGEPPVDVIGYAMVPRQLVQQLADKPGHATDPLDVPLPP